MRSINVYERKLRGAHISSNRRFCLQAQDGSKWPSVRERGLKGKVHVLHSSCSAVNGNYETKYKYEFARSGALTRMTSPNFKQWDCILATPTSVKVTQRNERGDFSEVSAFLEGDLVEKERYEYEYDSVGNWIKQRAFLMRKYEMEAGSWKAGEWQAKYLCKRAIEYYR